MKKRCAVVIAIMMIASSTHAQAAVKPGSSCPKVGATSILLGKKYTCIKSGNKLVWNKGVLIRPTIDTSAADKAAADKAAADKAAADKEAAEKAEAARLQAEKLAAEKLAAQLAAERALAEKIAGEKAAAYRASLSPCASDGTCKVGNIGPGGGVVFYVAPTPQPWGRYLEAAPSNWAGSYFDPYTQWCALGDTLLAAHINNPEAIKKNSATIGSGAANTVLMLSSCMNGIANLVDKYRGGGKKDWFIPSTDEMTLLLKMHEIVGDLSNSSYWSSTLAPVYGGWDQIIPIGTNYTSDETNASSVRPIRAIP